MEIRARRIECDEADEHILRRLGSAVALLWDALPEGKRGLILLQAVHMVDRHQPVQLEQQIEAFIQRHKLPV
jgi:hypothetical protein